MRRLTGFALLGLIASFAVAQEHRPSLSGCHALKGVTVITRPGTRLNEATVIVRDGLIEAVGKDCAVPADAEVIDGSGLVVTAGFTVAGPAIGARPSTPDPRQPDDVTSMPDDWARIGISPQRDVRPLLDADQDPLPGGDWLAQGVTTVIVHPSGRLIAGRAAVLSTAAGTAAERLLRNDVGLVVGFARGRGGYPSSLMGAVAALRQTFHDTTRLRVWQERFKSNPKGLKAPPHWPELEAAIPALTGAMPTIFTCRTEMDVRRATGLAREFSLTPWLRGKGGLGEGAARAAQANAVAILDVGVAKPVYRANRDWLEQGPSTLAAGNPGERPVAAKDTDGGGTATAPEADPFVAQMRAIRAGKEREELESHVTAGAVLERAGVRTLIAIDEPKGLIDQLKTQVRFGLRDATCLAALTELPADLLGFAGALGRVETGYRADLVVWQGEPLGDGVVAHVFCRGERYDLTERKKAKADGDAKGVDISGTWTIDVEGRDAPARLELERKDGGYGGTYVTSRGDAEVSSVKVSGKNVVIVANVSGEGFELQITLDGTISDDGKSMSGDVKFGEFGERTFKATKGGGR